MFLTHQTVRFCRNFHYPPPKLFVGYKLPGKRKWQDPNDSGVEDLSSLHRSLKDFILYETLSDPPDLRITSASSGLESVPLNFISIKKYSFEKRNTWPAIYNYISHYPNSVFRIWGSYRQRYLSVFAVAYFITKWSKSSNVPSLQNYPIFSQEHYISIKSAKEPGSCVGSLKDQRLEVLYIRKLSLCLFRIKVLNGETCNNLPGEERGLTKLCRLILPDSLPGRSLSITEGIRPIFSVSYSQSQIKIIRYLIKRRCGRFKPRHFKSFLCDLRSCIKILWPSVYRKKVRKICKLVISSIFARVDHPSTFTTRHFQQNLTHQPSYF